MKKEGKLALPQNLGIKNIRGADHKDTGKGKAGGKHVSNPIGAKEMSPGKSPQIKK